MILLTIWILFILADATAHWFFIQNRFTIYHDVAGLYRILWAVALFIVFGDGGFLSFSAFMFAAFFSFWLIFNISLNLMRGLPISYLGEDSLLDRIEEFVTFRVAAPVKLALAVQFWIFYFNNL